MFPSGPVVIWVGAPPSCSYRYSVITPAVVILPIFPPVGSVNHKLPSGPGCNSEWIAARGYSVFGNNSVYCNFTYFVSAYGSVNQRLPSGPTVYSGWRIARVYGVLSNNSIYVYFAYVSYSRFCKPEVTIRSSDDTNRFTALSRNRIINNRRSFSEISCLSFR